ncbi:MAG: hypothetical protein QOF74_2413 [Caballeronia mineralivorans]|jgi:maleate cis-trans isomerase|nr:hypothetical protein [Caballeronia mineralivorans]
MVYRIGQIVSSSNTTMETEVFGLMEFAASHAGD